MPLLIAAIYVAIEVVLFTFHEPWLDEAQAWLWSQRLSSFQDFLVIPGEGHPPLWYWLMRLLSMVLTFDQARPLMLIVTATNALLLARLLRDKPALLAVLLGALPILHSWGFQFRPYPIILTLVVSALLLDERGRSMTATWLMAIACGFSFLSGWLLAFWLLLQLHRGTPIAGLLPPSLLGAVFGVSAILSSLGNYDAGMQHGPLHEALFDVLALPFAIPGVNAYVIVAVTMAIIGYGLRRSPFVLVSIGILLVILSLFGAFVYGLREWHAAFGLMLVFMGFVVTRASVWPLVLLLLAQDFWGVRRAIMDIQFPDSAATIAYQAVLKDAGEALDTERNLVAWPDHVLTPAAASYGFRFISGNNGAVVDAIDWRRGLDGDISVSALTQRPAPYWFVCFQCEDPLAVIEAAGLRATQIMPETVAISWTLAAYRIDVPPAASP